MFKGFFIALNDKYSSFIKGNIKLAVISTLSILTKVNTSGLSSGLKKGESMLKSFGSQVSSVKGLLMGMGTALAGSAAIGALTSLTSNAMEAMDATAKLADSIGVSTEALTSLRYGAGLAGASTEDMDKALTIMMKNLGANSKAFEEIGLDPKKLKSQDAIQSFGEIADAINKLPNAADRANAAMSIFGKGGMALMPTLQGGSESIKAMADEADRLGITFSRLDAAKVELANDAMSKLGTIMTSLGQEIAIQVAPIIQGIAESLLDAANEGFNFGQIVSTALRFVIKGAGILADVWHTVKLAFTGVQVLIQKGLALIVRGFSTAVQFMERQVNKILAILPEWAKKKTGLTGPIDFSSGLDSFADSLETSAGDASKAWMEEFTGKTPSEKLDAWYEEVKAKSDKAAKEIVKAAEKVNEVDMTPKLPFSGDDMSRWWFNAKGSMKDWWNNLGEASKGITPEKIEMKQPSLIMKGSQEANTMLFDWQNLLEGGQADTQKDIATETKAQTTILQDILLSLKEKYMPKPVEDLIASF